MVDGIIELIGYVGIFNNLGNCNIYEYSIFGRDIYTVYYGDHGFYGQYFEYDTLKIEENKHDGIMKSRFEHLKKNFKNSYSCSSREYRLDIDDIFKDALLETWEVWT